MEKFEYKAVFYDTKGFFGGRVDENKLTAELNALGREGWEMVSSTTTSQSYGSSVGIVCIFKRKIEE
ncbi:MAG: DUF4177 domain-containing protein [Clostridia bacterium]|nr:DUF4177 domain-containing protein [Clostridia bacterium]